MDKEQIIKYGLIGVGLYLLLGLVKSVSAAIDPEQTPVLSNEGNNSSAPKLKGDFDIDGHIINEDGSWTGTSLTYEVAVINWTNQPQQINAYVQLIKAGASIPIYSNIKSGLITDVLPPNSWKTYIVSIPDPFDVINVYHDLELYVNGNLVED